jgi:hypothetical protein
MVASASAAAGADGGWVPGDDVFNYLERKLGVDLDGDGDIGEAGVASAPRQRVAVKVAQALGGEAAAADTSAASAARASMLEALRGQVWRPLRPLWRPF